MHWVQSTTLWQHFLCMGNSQEAIFTGIVDAVLKGEEIVQRKENPLARCLESRQLLEL